MAEEETRYTFDRVVRMVLGAAVLVALLALLRYLSDVLLPFVAAVVLAYLLNPLVTLVEQKTKRRGAAVALTLAGLGIVGLAAVAIVIPLMAHQVSRFGKDLEQLRQDLVAQGQAALDSIEEPPGTVPGSGADATGGANGAARGTLPPSFENVAGAQERIDRVRGDRDGIDRESVDRERRVRLAAPSVPRAAESEPASASSTSSVGWGELRRWWAVYKANPEHLDRATRFGHLRRDLSGTYLGELLENAITYLESDEFGRLLVNAAKHVVVGGWTVVAFAANLLIGLTGLIIVLLYLVFLLLDYPQYARTWKAFLPPAYRTPIAEFLEQFDTALRRYFRGQAIVAICMGVLFSIGFTIIGLPMAVPLGLFIGLLNMVPYLQAVGLVPALLLALLRSLEGDSSVLASVFLTLIVFAVAQLIQDSLITPRVMGKATGLRPVAILLGVFIWGKLLGFMGLLVAIPLTCLGIAYYRRYILQQAPDPA